MNNITAEGRLGRDSELKTVRGDLSVLSFSLASDVGFGDRKVTNWFRVSLFGKRAETLAPYLKKGSPVIVTGSVTVKEFTKADGTHATQVEIAANDVCFIGPRVESKIATTADGDIDF